MNILESQSLAQLAAMRQAVAEFKQNQQDSLVEGYGHNIVVNDEDLSDENFDDIWDLFSEAEEDDSGSDISNNLGFTKIENDQDKSQFDLEWLRNQCDALSNRRHTLDAGQLQDQLCSLLFSDMKGACSIPLPRLQGTHLLAHRR